MRYPLTARDVFAQSAGVAATKDRFLATARLVQAGATYIFDIENCPAIAVNPGIIADLGETETKILARKDFFENRPAEYQNIHQMVAGTYLWIKDKMVVLQRTGNVAASGLLTNPGGVCDGHPSQVMDDELVEETCLTWLNNDALIVPVLYNATDSVSEIERKIALKAQQKDTFSQIADARQILAKTIVFEPVAVQPRSQDHALPGFSTVEVRCGDIVCDRIETPVHVHFTPEWNAWNFHKSCDLIVPEGVDIIMMDGEGFARPGFLKVPEELADENNKVLGFLRDYARDVVKARLAI